MKRINMINKTAIDGGLAYIVENLDSNNVTITGPDHADNFKQCIFNLKCNELNDNIELWINHKLNSVIPTQIGEDTQDKFQSMVKSVLKDVCSANKFVYVKDGDNYSPVEESI